MNTRVTQSGNIFNINDGTIKGRNQFHSFDRFSVSAGDVASFSGPAGIENILSRVTGGMSSEIYGTLRTSIDGANLFLLNPAGVVFGPSASLDINGSFFVSTADFVSLGQDGIFYADLSQNSLLTMAPPSAFGFLGQNPPELAAGSSAAVAIEGLDARGNPVVVVGRDGMPEGGQATVEGVGVTGNLTSDGGKVTLASVAAPGDVPITDSDSVSLFGENGVPLLSKLGGVEITDAAVIDVSGEAGGSVVIRGGVLMLENAAMRADTRGDANDAAVGIDVRMSERISLSGKKDDTAGGEDAGAIGFFTGSESNGRGRDIHTQAPEILLAGESQILSETGGGGKGGDVLVTADTVTMTDDAEIASDVEQTSTAEASGGDVTISAKTIIMTSGMDESPEISADTEGDGSGGSITLNATEQISIRMGDNSGGIFSNTKGGNGNAGTITIETADFQMEGGLITTGTETAGEGGRIQLNAAQMHLSGEAQIISDTRASGRGGDLVITTDTLMLTDDAEIASDVENTATAGARGGNVAISAERITLESRAGESPEISADTEGDGSGGSITLIATEQIDIRIQGEEGGIFTNSKNGIGLSGAIALETPVLQMDGGVITARTETSGKGGSIQIQSGQIQLKGGAAVSAQSTSEDLGAGLAGDITISGVDTLQLDQNSSVTSQAAVADGGNISIQAESEVRLNDARITTAVGRGDGGGGNIFIDPQIVVLEGFSQVVADAFGGPGGNIDIIAGAFLADAEKSTVSASSVLDIDGQINIDAITDLSGAITPLQERFSEVASLLRQRCAERLRGGQVSSLIVGGREAFPREPGELLPGPLFLTQKSEAFGRKDRQSDTADPSAGLIEYDHTRRARVRGWPSAFVSETWLDLECAGWLTE